MQIAQLINGTVEGNPEQVIQAFGKIEQAHCTELSFLANPKYEDFLYSTKAGVVIVNQSLQLKAPVNSTLIRVDDAYSAFALLLRKYEELKKQQLSGIEQPSFIHPTAKVGNQVFIGAFSYIKENVVIGFNSKIYPQVHIGNSVKIGNNCIIYPNVTIYDDTIIGNNVTIHAGAVIGADGFGFAPEKDGTYKKIPQLGNVIIEDDVEIGANCCIDRATMGSTILSKGVKLDNLVQIAHNVEIGTNTVIAAQTGVSGSSKVGKYVMMGGQVGIAGHIQIADGTKVGGQSGINQSVEMANQSLNGSPALPYKLSLRTQVLYKQLP
ncbi:MAG: UDP-3-O-(3-hydroxymyristoyl)glucosamine N-acyltransferase, partial [Chitinophagaceae bacterium]